ncbi:pyridoxal phosphate-dependent transferase, partial [Paraphysoderma sedebokerense]
VTRPTEEMYRVMADAAVGDDVFGEDPTTNLLESYTSQLLSHSSGLFCTSGTLSNQLALRTHLIQPPYSILCDSRCHINLWESAGVSYHCGAGVNPVTPKGNWLTADEIEKGLVLGDDIHVAATKVVVLENTLNGGIFPLEEIKKIRNLTDKYNIKLHLDGARLWNASMATGISLNEWGKYFDSISVCFSKGLGAPVGSMLVGSKEFIKKARHFRKLYGGGWRQSGPLAAACLHALTHHFPSQLQQDHIHASFLASSLSKLGIKIVSSETNMIFLDFSTLNIRTNIMADKLVQRGVKVSGDDGFLMRLVVHRDVCKDDLNVVVE